MSDKLYVIKIGGNIVDNPAVLKTFLAEFAQLKMPAILVHGGGKLATKLATDLQVEQQMVDGRRITDAETLKIVTMVYAGFINKNIVASLQALGVNAIGLTGADGNLIQSHKREHATIDYGFVGDVDQINTAFVGSLLKDKFQIVVAPITHDKKGQLLNTNADTIAQTMATGLSQLYNVHLIYGFEREGVLKDINDSNSVISTIDRPSYETLKNEKVIFEGMIPKIDNAFEALTNGVKSVIIGKAEKLTNLINGTAGTTITK